MTFRLHLTLGFSYSKVAFDHSFSQSDSCNFSSLFLITIKLENMKTLHNPHLWIFTKKKYLQYLIKYFRILQFDSPFSRKCLLHASCCDNIFSSLELKMCAFFTSRAILHFLYSSMLITNLCTNVV